MTDYAPSGVAQSPSGVAKSPSGEAQPYLPHVTRLVQRSVHAKFHADWTITEGARGIQTNRQTVLFLLYGLAYRPAPRTFQLALRGYSVASLPRASRSLRSCAFCTSRSRIFSKKKSVSQSTQNALKRLKLQKKIFYPFWPITRFARSAQLTKIWKKKCVSIDSKCSETHRNAKNNFTPLTGVAKPNLTYPM